MLRQRQRDLLKKIVLIYTETAEPVGSTALAAEGDFDVSAATIRNDMAELEGAGYIYQPHTSAGRVPTEKGYLFYVNNYVFDGQERVGRGRLNSSAKAKLDRIINSQASDDDLKNLAMVLAELSEGLIILAFDEDRTYYTGLSYLYSQPEFAEQAAVTTVSQVLDHCEQVMAEIFDLVSQEERILIGRANPFSRQCSFLAAPFGRGLIGILGPLRMDYEMNFNLLDYVSHNL